MENLDFYVIENGGPEDSSKVWRCENIETVMKIVSTAEIPVEKDDVLEAIKGRGRWDSIDQYFVVILREPNSE